MIVGPKGYSTKKNGGVSEAENFDQVHLIQRTKKS